MNWGSKIWRTILVLVLWVPVPLIAAMPGLTPSWFHTFVFGVPLSVWVVVILTVVLIGLTWLFSVTAEAESGERS
jgi:hypothetical protein